MSKSKAIGQAAQPTREYMRRIEINAMKLRCRAQVSNLAPLDPCMCASKLNLKFVDLGSISELQADTLESLMSLDARTWSGISKELPDGTLLIALNPNMTPERANVTIMEEAAHAHYGHSPTQLCSLEADFYQRIYDDNTEQEAYWTAAAALLPAKAVGLAMYRGETADDLAIRYDVSTELAEMRIKTLGLWSYLKPPLN